jgi:hypothetical protein
MGTRDNAQVSNHGDWEDQGTQDFRTYKRAFGREAARLKTWFPRPQSGWLPPSDPYPPLSQVVDGIEIYSTKISCKVTSRFACNVVTTRAVNHADKAKEVSFDVELPKTAFITNFTLWVPL